MAASSEIEPASKSQESVAVADPSETAAADESLPNAKRTKIQTGLILLALYVRITPYPAFLHPLKLVTYFFQMGVCLAALDITIVTTALPTIASEFHSGAGYVWVGSAYLLAAAAATPSWGKLSDIWGRKVLLLAAVAIFFLGSAICGTAVSIEMLVAGRAVQGAAGGGLLTLPTITIGDLFSHRLVPPAHRLLQTGAWVLIAWHRQRGKYFGILGLVWAVASAMGSLVGGAFTSRVTWRWCFYLNRKFPLLSALGSVYY